MTNLTSIICRIIYIIYGRSNNESKNILDHKKFWKKFVSSKIHEYEEKLWQQRISAKPKLRTYVKFKNKLRMEKYLLADTGHTGRSIHTSLRSGTNKPKIETDRWSGILKHFRFCTNCDNKQVESEEHFLLYCSKYNLLRTELFQKILQLSNGKWDLKSRSVDDALILLLQGTGDQFESQIFRLFHSYLQKCLRIRV